jgi:hypothetical protein
MILCRPDWNPDAISEFRIKPEPKPDVEGKVRLCMLALASIEDEKATSVRSRP